MREISPNSCLYSLCWNHPPSLAPHLQSSAPFNSYTLSICALLTLFILIAGLGLWYSRVRGDRRSPGGSKRADMKVLMTGLERRVDTDNLVSGWLRVQKFPTFRNCTAL